MDHNSKEFKKLQQKWYKKLEKDGFDDIEQDDGHLKKWSTTFLTRSSNRDREIFFKAKEDYFRLVGYFLHDHVFEDKTDKLIWEYHADGRSIRETSMLLKKKRVQMAPTQVKETIHRLREEMFSKYEDLND